MEQPDDTLDILTYPDPVLRNKAETIEEIDGELQRLIDDMLHTMYSAPGIGLAANQVGKLKQVIVFDLRPTKEGQDPVALINPEIVMSEGLISYEESCLSVIDFSTEVTRSSHVKVQGLDRHGSPLDIEAEGLLAICLQHEIDHLKGVLFIDYMSSVKRALYKKRLLKKLKTA
ncbi:MAG: peptide deformylase [Thermodesulfobacteriota bacterium]|nr:peptide deformylase [Thermodesulfobacteriota bacterium]